jgi:hypothetical protein
MTAKLLTHEIERHVWPALGELGFDETSNRVAWRHLPDRILVVDIAAPPRSEVPDGSLAVFFQLHLGIDFRVAGHRDASMERPRHSGCHIVKRLEKKLEQPGCPPWMWSVEGDGSNIDEVITELRRALVDEATDWFATCHDLEALIAALRRPAFEAWFAVGGSATADEVIRTLAWLKTQNIAPSRVGAI